MTKLALASGDVLCSVRGLRTTFETAMGPATAVDGVNLDIRAGRTLGVVGESGSGKSVLTRSIMGLLPRDRVRTEGSVVHRGVELARLTREERRRYWGVEMSMVLQDPMTSLTPTMRVGDQIIEGLRHHLGMSRVDAKGRAIGLLREVGIPEPERRLSNFPHQLSGGMRQRVTIAMALACDPSLLFADEPTTALDVTVQAQILELLDRECEQRQMAVVLVTHDLGVVASHAQEVAVMYAGQIVEQASTQRLFGNVHMPYTEALLRSIPRLENEPHTVLDAIPGRPPELLHIPKGCRFATRCLYAQDQCLNEPPPLTATADDSGHLYRCWFPVGSTANDAARRRNIDRGTTAAGTPVSVAVGSTG